MHINTHLGCTRIHLYMRSNTHLTIHTLTQIYLRTHTQAIEMEEEEDMTRIHTLENTCKHVQTLTHTHLYARKQAIEMEEDMLFHLNYSITLVNSSLFDKVSIYPSVCMCVLMGMYIRLRVCVNEMEKGMYEMEEDMWLHLIYAITLVNSSFFDKVCTNVCVCVCISVSICVYVCMYEMKEDMLLHLKVWCCTSTYDMTLVNLSLFDCLSIYICGCGCPCVFMCVYMHTCECMKLASKPHV